MVTKKIIMRLNQLAFTTLSAAWQWIRPEKMKVNQVSSKSEIFKKKLYT